MNHGASGWRALFRKSSRNRGVQSFGRSRKNRGRCFADDTKRGLFSRLTSKFRQSGSLRMQSSIFEELQEVQGKAVYALVLEIDSLDGATSGERWRRRTRLGSLEQGLTLVRQEADGANGALAELVVGRNPAGGNVRRFVFWGVGTVRSVRVSDYGGRRCEAREAQSSGLEEAKR